MTIDWKYIKVKLGVAARVSAAVLAGYAIATLLHLALALWMPDHRVVLASHRYSLFPVWLVFFLPPFFFRNPWKGWILYLGLILLLATAVAAGLKFSPIIPLAP